MVVAGSYGGAAELEASRERGAEMAHEASAEWSSGRVHTDVRVRLSQVVRAI